MNETGGAAGVAAAFDIDPGLSGQDPAVPRGRGGESLGNIPYRAGAARCNEGGGPGHPGAGHWLMEEAPQQVMPALTAFLK
jgi:hypothetical protein